VPEVDACEGGVARVGRGHGAARRLRHGNQENERLDGMRWGDARL
jgi:hypothetical protein